MLTATDSRVLDEECDLDLLLDCALGQEQNAYEACGFFFRKIKGRWCELEGDDLCCALEGSDCCEFDVLKSLMITLAVVVAIATSCFLCCCRRACCPPNTSMERATGDSPYPQPIRTAEETTNLPGEPQSQMTFDDEEFPSEEMNVDGDYYHPSYRS